MSAASLLLGCFEGPPPQSKVDLPEFFATQVSKLCFSAASKELKSAFFASRLLRRSSTTIEGMGISEFALDSGAAPALRNCFEGAPPRSRGEFPNVFLVQGRCCLYVSLGCFEGTPPQSKSQQGTHKLPPRLECCFFASRLLRQSSTTIEGRSCQNSLSTTFEGLMPRIPPRLKCCYFASRLLRRNSTTIESGLARILCD